MLKKRILSIVLALTMLMVPGAYAAQPAKDDMRGVWVASVHNIDFPSEQGMTADQLKAEADTELDNIVAMGLNTVFLQVRPSADALYPSELFPWSRYVSGTAGQAPNGSFDVLGYWVTAAHERGLQLHAWINPYRITIDGEDEWNAIPDSSPAKQHPEWVIKYNDNYYFDPGIPAVQQLVVDGAAEIVKNYDVDGIHLDDYFYPTTETAFDAAAFADAKADDLGAFRLEQVNAMVQQIYSTVKAASPAIQLSISPQGTMDGNYTKQYADVRRWGTETGYCDVLIPQLYYGFANETAPFAEALQTWTETVSSESVSLVIGIGTHKCGKEDTWAGSGSMEWCSEPTLPIRQAKLALETNGTDGVAVYDYETTFQPDTAADALSQIREALGKLFRNGK